tara:strand:+ start:86 stop:625 length:540 start_codon:yes stop_codon:yes gene_type:complete
MKLNTLIIDNFLDNPDEIRNILINNKVSFKNSGSYPGKRTSCVDDIDYQNMIIQKLESILPFKIKMAEYSFPFQLCLSDVETWVHMDPYDWTGVLYLTPNAPLKSGTIFVVADDEIKEFISKDPTNKIKKESTVESVIGNVYNRMLLFRGDIPHSSNLAGFGDCLENGRLTQVFFFDEV